MVTQSEAERIASESGAEHGYDMNVFELRNSRQHDDGSWWVHFEHAPPTPPGGHFAVEVDAEGNARLMHGE